MSEFTKDPVAVIAPDDRLDTLRTVAALQGKLVSSADMAIAAGVSVATAKRRLERLVASGAVVRTGRARATRYAPAPRFPIGNRAASCTVREPDPASPPWSPASLRLACSLRRPLMTREIVTYQRHFVDNYVPNETSLLPPDAAAELTARARMRGQQPAGTYARRVLEPLLIDLSWSSSRLEGNRYSMLATRELFLSGMSGEDGDAVMLLNHKRAIEFLVDAAPRTGLTALLVRNLHAVLMQSLLTDTAALGAIRNKVVNISDTTYLPTQVPHLLEEMFAVILDKARRIANPVESAFFLWVNLAYLQPFEDGNKRTSRLAANVPLLLRNCAPLSFLGVEPDDYAMAMMGVYECLDVSMAADLFTWTYGRSIDKYAAVLKALGVPDPLRARYRESIERAVQAIVREGKSLDAVVASHGLPPAESSTLRQLVARDLETLQVYNCARFRISTEAAQAWIAQGRPLGSASSES
jgi:Fic family protein